MIIIIGSISSADKDIKIKENSVLTIDFKSKVVEHENESESSIFEIKEDAELKYQDILNAIETAKNDDKIKGISIELDDIDEDYNIENNEVTEEEKEGMLDTLYIDEGLIDPEEDF